jgi:hypothetical protein
MPLWPIPGVENPQTRRCLWVFAHIFALSRLVASFDLVC